MDKKNVGCSKDKKNKTTQSKGGLTWRK